MKRFFIGFKDRIFQSIVLIFLAFILQYWFYNIFISQSIYDVYITSTMFLFSLFWSIIVLFEIIYNLFIKVLYIYIFGENHTILKAELQLKKK